MPKQHIRAGLLLALAVLQSWLVAHSYAGEQRNVVINGERISGAQLQSLDGAHCDLIPDGNYWLSRRTGLWGYAGSARPQGYIWDPCLKQRRPPLSERGLYVPHSSTPTPREEMWREDFDIGTSTLPHAPDPPQEH